MSRPLRIEYPDAWYHVINRARRGQIFYVATDDYRRFLGLLQDTADMFSIRVSAYCLMPTHYHILVQTPNANMARCMRHINGVYTQRYNRRHGCDGTLFRGRYKSILVDADSYLLQLVRYIHKNPVRAGLAEKLSQYPWSSHKGYLSLSKKWDWLHKDFILSLLSTVKGGRLKAYKQFIKMEDSEEITQVFERKKWPTFLGDEKFVRWLKGKFFEQKHDPQIPESKILAPDLETIKKAVCSYYRVDGSELLKNRRGKFNEPKSVAIYLVRMLRNDGLLNISFEFGLKGYSSASSVLEGLRKKIQKNRQLRKRVEEIKNSVNIGQTET